MKQTHFTTTFKTWLIALMVMVSALPLHAQYIDDPNRDQVPWHLWEAPANTPKLPMSTVMTINNFDNFNLGVDFAESNIAENPLIPSWFFTAYNTNGTHRTENGLTWTDGSPSFGTTMSGDPVVCYDSLGNLFYENMYGSPSIQGVKVMKSTDNGATWGPSVTGVLGNDKNWIACDQTSGPYANYVYTCMTGGPGGNFARSTDHGATFTTTFSPTTQSIPGMMVCVGPQGNIQGKSVYVVTNSGSSFASTYTFYRSTDGGATFSMMSAQTFSNTVGTQVSGRNSVQNMRTRPYPMIAADNSYGPSRGRLYCVYASNDPPGNGNKPDIWCRYSTDGGATWSAAILVNDDPSPQTHHQWHPAIWCDKETGRLYAMWMDSRDCATHDSALIYASYSDNGGITWAANQAVSNQKMKIDCPTCGGGGTPRYQGDYNGVVSNKKVSMVGWTDFRSGSFMSTTAYFPDFAMAINKTSDTLYVASDSVDFIVSVPAVKLYSDTVVLSGQITPTPTAGTIAFSFPQGNKITTFPGSKIVRVKLTGNVPLSNYQAVFYAKGPNGTPVHQRNATITVLASQALAVTVSANPTSVCLGSSTQLQAAASGGTGPITYTWTSNPPGFTSSLPNPVATPTVNTRYICTVHDNTPIVAKDSVMVTIAAIPATPGTITGSTTPCAGTTAIYSINPVSGATIYTWTVPTGATILSGQNTVSITVQWGMTSGNVSVTAGNTCGTSTASQLAIAVATTPATPGPITGPGTVCINTTVNYSVPVVAGETNTWTVPSDATILSGQGTAAITVQWGVNAGMVSVTAQSGNCISQANSISVMTETLPGAAQPVTGSDTVCQGDGGYPYSIPAITNASGYMWTLPPGAVITQGQGTNSVIVDFDNNAISGAITAAGTNMCGTGTAGSKLVTVVVCTGTPEREAKMAIRIYPNPVRGLLNIALAGAEKSVELQITDLKGRVVYNEKLTNMPAESTRQVDTRGFAPGMYLLRVISDGESVATKFAVE